MGNAIFFGGTDRTLRTHLHDLLRQSPPRHLSYHPKCLADNTYMNVMRDLYGDQIWIPTPRDTNQAFQKYVQDVQSGRIQAGADLTEGGRVQVQGVAGVMKINALLCKQLFDNNQQMLKPNYTSNPPGRRRSCSKSPYPTLQTPFIWKNPTPCPGCILPNPPWSNPQTNNQPTPSPPTHPMTPLSGTGIPNV